MIHFNKQLTLAINRHRHVYLLAAILLLGLILRIYNLGEESLWRDEVYSVNTAHLNLVEIFNNEDTNPPLHYIFLHFWQKQFGDSEYSIRFLSLIFGIFNIALIYKFAEKLFNREVGVISALILSVSTFHICYSQEARAYSLMVFLSLLSTLFYIKLSVAKQPRYIIGYIIATSLLAYSHVYAIFVIIAHNLYYICTIAVDTQASKIKFKEWFLIQLAVLVLFSPWLSILLSKSLGVAKKGFWIPEPDFSDLYQTIVLYIGHPKLKWIYALSMLSAAISLIFFPKEYQLNMRSIYQTLKSRLLKADKRTISNLLLLLILFISLLILPFLISKISTPIFQSRYTIVASITLYILLAWLVANVASRFLKIAAICLILGLSISNVWSQYYQVITREQWREASRYIDLNYKQGDLLIFSTNGSIDAFNYYSKNATLQKLPYISTDSINHTVNKDQLLSALPAHERVWAVLNDFRKADNSTIKKMIADYQFSEKENQRFKGIEIYLYQQ